MLRWAAGRGTSALCGLCFVGYVTGQAQTQRQGNTGVPAFSISSISIQSCSKVDGPVLYQEAYRCDAGPSGPGLCRIVHAGFRESVFHALGCISPGCCYEPLHSTVSITYPRRVAPASGYCSGGPRCSIPTLAAAAFSFSMSGSPGGGKVRSRAGSPASATKRSKPAGRVIAKDRSVSSPSTA